uniref:Uncharacterized protein n=1 Tax=Anguilla anguilla TaxID=7936 RepID=A0A0E9S5K4_ANGAN
MLVSLTASGSEISYAKFHCT